MVHGKSLEKMDDLGVATFSDTCSLQRARPRWAMPQPQAPRRHGGEGREARIGLWKINMIRLSI